MRRLAAVAAFGAACAAVIVIAAGGGGRSSRPLSGPLDPVLGHFPRAAPFVAVVDRRLDAERRRALTALVARLGFGRTAGVLESVLGGVVRPPVAIGLERPVALRHGAIGHSVVVAAAVADGARARRLVRRPPRGFVARLDRGVLLLSRSRTALAAAVRSARSPVGLRGADMAAAVEGLPAGRAAVRIAGAPRALLAATPRLQRALRLPWFDSLRRAGATLTPTAHGFAVALRAHTDRLHVHDRDLPLPPGGGSPIAPIGRRSEIAVAVREPARVLGFAARLVRALEPTRAARLAIIARIVRARGADLRRDLAQRLGVTAALAVAPKTHALALRAPLRDPAAFRDALVKVAGALPDFAAALGIRGLGLATPDVGESFYALARPDGKTLVFGVVGSTLVAASDPRRAAELITEPSRHVAGATGGLVAAIPLDRRTRLTLSLAVDRGALSGRGSLTFR